MKLLQKIKSKLISRRSFIKNEVDEMGPGEKKGRKNVK